jgi:hypothetical protein
MTPVPAGDQARKLIDRIRASLPGGQVREVRMFGAIAVMVDDAMAVAVHKNGSCDPSVGGSGCGAAG